MSAQTIIIDPPVSPYSEPAEIEAWIDDLEALREKFAGDEGALPTIEQALEEARRWLARRDEQGAREIEGLKS